MEALRAKLADAEKRAAVAEAIAEERERIIAVQAQALRMLESPKTSVRRDAENVGDLVDVPTVRGDKSKDVLDDAQGKPRRRWWQRP